MSVLGATIVQDNRIEDGSNLLAVHSPLVFIIDVEYSGTAPDYFYVDLYDSPGMSLLGSYKMIPYLDVSSTHRQFIFIADPIIRGFMEDFPDFAQTGQSLVVVADITKQFYLVFKDTPPGTPETVGVGCGPITCLVSARQFGENPNAQEIYDNDPDTYYGAANKPIYIYFYNTSAANVLTVEDHISSPEMTGEFTRNNCPVGQTGETVTFTITYTSYVSKADLDAQVANFNIDGQAYANQYGSCMLPAFEDDFTDLTKEDIFGYPEGWSAIIESDKLKATVAAGGHPSILRFIPQSGGSTLLLTPGNYRFVVKVDRIPDGIYYNTLLELNTGIIGTLVEGVNTFEIEVVSESFCFIRLFIASEAASDYWLIDYFYIYEL